MHAHSPSSSSAKSSRGNLWPTSDRTKSRDSGLAWRLISSKHWRRPRTIAVPRSTLSSYGLTSQRTPSSSVSTGSTPQQRSALENPIRKKLGVGQHYEEFLPDKAPLRPILQVIQQAHPASNTTRARRAWSPSVRAGEPLKTIQGQSRGADRPPARQTSMSHMPSQDGFIHWRLLGTGCSPSLTPFKKRAGWSTFEYPLPTSQEHKVRKVTNAGTRLCSYVPVTKNMVISEQYTLKTSNSWEGILKVVSEFPPPGIIGAGKSPTSTILLEVILWDPPDNFVEVLPGFKLKWTSGLVQKELGAFIRDREQPLLHFTFGWEGGGGDPAWSWGPLSGYQQDPCWSGRAQKAEVHARRPHLRPKLGGPRPFELVWQQW